MIQAELNGLLDLIWRVADKLIAEHVWGIIAELANYIAWDAVDAQIEPYLHQSP